jgi:hypothetical protein
MSHPITTADLDNLHPDDGQDPFSRKSLREQYHQIHAHTVLNKDVKGLARLFNVLRDEREFDLAQELQDETPKPLLDAVMLEIAIQT